MNPFFIYILIGFGTGIFIFPAGLFVFLKIKNAKERRGIKRMMRNNQFLVPIDPQDYDVKAWQGKKFGNINPKDQEEDLKNLNTKIFKKIKVDEENPFENEKDEVSKDFLTKVGNYLNIAREKGYSDEYIIQEFKKKHYSEELIKKIFEQYGRRQIA